MGQGGGWEHGPWAHLMVSWENLTRSRQNFPWVGVGTSPHEEQEAGALPRNDTVEGGV